MNEEEADNFAKRVMEFAADYASGYLYDPDGTQLSADMNLPLKTVLSEYNKIAERSEYMTKEEYLEFTSRMNQYLKRIVQEMEAISAKMAPATERISAEIAEDISNGNF